MTTNDFRPETGVAYSYIRWSNPSQALGDSLRRQMDETEAWCRRNGFALDASLSLRDMGVSAYRGRHRSDKAALGQFLEAVRSGRVAKGSFLVIENLDRLSREDERTALRLWMDILDAGINIVQLKPETVFRHEKSDMMDIMRAIIELSRGHKESEMKSDRIGSAWAEKKRRARAGEDQKPTKSMGEGSRLLTRRLPAWVSWNDGRPALIPERVSLVRRIFAMTANGYSNAAVARRLTREGVAAWGNSNVRTILRALRNHFKGDDVGVVGARGHYVSPCPLHKGDGPALAVDVDGDGLVQLTCPRGCDPDDILRAVKLDPAQVRPVWSKTYITHLINDRRAVGDHQPHDRHKRPDGKPIKNYYPAAVTEEEYRAARDDSLRRVGEDRLGKKRRGRPSEFVNLFVHLLRNARDGDTYQMSTRSDPILSGGQQVGRCPPYRVLVNGRAIEGKERFHAFRYDVFERAVLSMLWEVVPSQVFDNPDGGDPVAALEGELAQVRDRVARLKAELVKGDVAAIAEVLRDLEPQEKNLVARLDQARLRAATPLTESWTQLKTLVAALDDAEDREAARLRLRSVLRRVLDSIWLAVTARGRDRLCTVQVKFVGGEKSRFYDILYRHERDENGEKVIRWWASSVRVHAGPDVLDYEKPADVALALEELERFHPDLDEEFDPRGGLTWGGVLGREDPLRPYNMRIGLEQYRRTRTPRE
jgi:DNA invertase Pin-like site-specific DNA recombinase